MANQVTIDVEARFIDNVTGGAKSASNAFDKLEKDARDAAKAVDSVSKKKATPSLDANTSKFKKAIDDSDKKLTKFGRTKATAKLGAEDKATSKIDKVLSKIKSIAGKTKSVVLTAKDYATAKITSAINAARSFAGKTYSAMVRIRDSEALASIRKITSGAEGFANKVWTVTVKLKDLITSPLRGIQNMLFSMKTLVMTIAAGVATQQLILNPLSVADQYSSAKISFSTLLGESQGQQMMNDLDAFAAATPFNTSNVISNAQKMLAMGWEAENIIADMEIIGNAAAATGKLDQGLESIVRALSQIKTKGRLSTEELNQLAEAGIAAKAMLAEQLGYGTGDAGIAAMTKDLEEGLIASDVALEALLAGMQKYNGMMDSMANETVEGLKSQLQDAFEINVVRRWGQGLQDGARRGLGSVLSLLDEAEAAMAEFGDTVYEIGKTLSNWAADKLENAIKRITDITGTFEFQNASLKDKISMLWKGVIVDPLKEWWDGGGQQKTAETAGKIGEWLGKAITSGLLAILGVTDILDESNFPVDENGNKIGMSVAQSFVEGFKANFDGSAITDAIVDAIGDVWGALPTWAKILVGGYGIGKVAGGISNVVGGVMNFAGNVKTAMGGFGAHIAPVGPALVTGSGILGTVGKTGVALGATTTGGALLLGSASIAGGIAAGASALKGGYEIYQYNQALKKGDETEAEAHKASANGTLNGLAAGALAGAGIGALFGGVGAVPGALIGAAIGGIGGMFFGNKNADEIREAAIKAEYANEQLAEAAVALQNGEKSAEEFGQELEQFKLEKARECFGDISLSMEEIARLSQQIVFGDDLPKYEKFSAATQQAVASLQALNLAGQQTDRWLWKARIGVKFSQDEVASIKASFEEYINSAKQYVEDKHYEFTASAELLLDLTSGTGKSILQSGNAYYAEIQKNLNAAGKELGNELTKALKDGIISADESAAIAAAQQKIADITKKIAEANTDAELTLIGLKFGGGNLDKDSFDALTQTIQSHLNESIGTLDAAVTAQIASLNLQFPEDQRNSAEYNQKLQAILDGYNMEVESVKAKILGVELEIISEAFDGKDMLGEDALGDLQTILQTCLNDGIEPVKMDLSQLIELSGNPELGDDNAGLIQDYLQGVYNQLDLSGYELIEVDGTLKLNLNPEIESEGGNLMESVTAAVQQDLTEAIKANVPVTITGEKQVEAISLFAEEFGVPESVAASTVLQLTASDTLCEQLTILKDNFGIADSYAWETLVNLTGDPDYNTIKPTAADFGIPDSISTTMDIFITGNPIYNNGGNGSNPGNGSNTSGEGFRGGIFGGNIPGFSNGGIVRGGSQLIEVAEEGSPEMVIPLSSQRRGRGLKLWAQAGNIMGVPGFARGGIIGGDGSSDEGIRFRSFGDNESAGGQNVQVEVGGITVEINVDASNTDNIADAIRAQANEIAETVAGIMADAIGGQYENTPLRGGVA